MAIRNACRRQARRYSLDGSRQAWVEFDFPERGGRRFRFSIVDLSISGFSFTLIEPLEGLDAGSQFSSVRLILGDCEISGEMLVMHVTPESGIVCGALFYPASDEELLKLKGVIAGIDTAQTI